MEVKELAELIKTEIGSRSIVLVGPTFSGKTHWVKNFLIPFLEEGGKKVEYLEDGEHVSSRVADIVIVDEAEVLFDKDYLQKENPSPYYTEAYLERVKKWFENYARLPKSTLFIVTRNKPDQIKNLLNNMTDADWDGRSLLVLEFPGP